MSHSPRARSIPFLGVVLLASACGAKPSLERASVVSPSPSTTVGPSATANTAATAVEGRDDGEELDWDSSVGWELRRVFPEGVTSMPRRDEDFLKLRYSGLPDHPEWLDVVVASKGKLENKPILGTGDEICNPHLGAILRKKALPRLLLTVEGGLRPEHLACLEHLDTPRLYLSLCPQAKPDNYRSCGGEADLQTLATASPTLARRIRGLGVALQAPDSWKLLRTFPNLSYLTVKGAASGRFDPRTLFELCARADLVHLDILDPAEIVGSTGEPPTSCGLLQQSFEGWKAPTPVPGQACNLRRLFVWNLEERDRLALERACPALHAIEVVRTQMRYRR